MNKCTICNGLIFPEHNVYPNMRDHTGCQMDRTLENLQSSLSAAEAALREIAEGKSCIKCKAAHRENCVLLYEDGGTFHNCCAEIAKRALSTLHGQALETDKGEEKS